MPARELAGQGVVGVKSGGEGAAATLLAPLLPSLAWRSHELLPKDLKHQQKHAEEDDEAD